MITFRPVKKCDLKELLGIFNYYIMNSNAVWYTREITMEEFLNVIPFGDKKYKTYVIMNKNVLLGYCAFKRYSVRQAYDRTVEISIYIAPGCTGMGTGTKALKFLEKKAKKSGIRNILGIISGDNRASIRLFKHEGYVKCATIRKAGEKSGKVLDVVIYQKLI